MSDALNNEMKAAYFRIFIGGLQQTRRAKPLRAQPDGEVFITEGQYLNSKEDVGGFGYWRPLI